VRITVVGAVLIAMAIIALSVLLRYLRDRANRKPQQTRN
jgi:TRAP-type mannitol/chloroaromatic compound transport system permease large subunit